MTNAPYLLPKAREGYRLGHAQVIDSMINDGLWDSVQATSTWATAPSCARRRRGSRAPSRTRSRPSRTGARCARRPRGSSSGEIVPVEIAQRKGPPKVVADDEEPGRGDVEKLAALRPAFQKDGTVTAGNASSINDGAAALVLTARTRRRRAAEAAGAHRRRRPGTRRRPSGSPPRRPARSSALLEQASGWKQGRRRPLGDQRGVRGRVDREQPDARARSRRR